MASLVEERLQERQEAAVLAAVAAGKSDPPRSTRLHGIEGEAKLKAVRVKIAKKSGTKGKTAEDLAAEMDAAQRADGSERVPQSLPSIELDPSDPLHAMLLEGMQLNEEEVGLEDGHEDGDEGAGDREDADGASDPAVDSDAPGLEQGGDDAAPAPQEDAPAPDEDPLPIDPQVAEVARRLRETIRRLSGDE